WLNPNSRKSPGEFGVKFYNYRRNTNPQLWVSNQKERRPGKRMSEVGGLAFGFLHQLQHSLSQRLGSRNRFVLGVSLKNLRHQDLRRSILHTPVRHKKRSCPSKEKRSC